MSKGFKTLKLKNKESTTIAIRLCQLSSPRQIAASQRTWRIC